MYYLIWYSSFWNSFLSVSFCYCHFSCMLLLLRPLCWLIQYIQISTCTWTWSGSEWLDGHCNAMQCNAMRWWVKRWKDGLVWSGVEAESGALIRNVVSGHSYAEHNCIQSERTGRQNVDPWSGSRTMRRLGRWPAEYWPGSLEHWSEALVHTQPHSSIYICSIAPSICDFFFWWGGWKRLPRKPACKSLFICRPQMIA